MILLCLCLYGSIMIILCLCYDYICFIAYIRIYKSYDRDDMPLNQMVLKHNSEVNDEDEVLENEVNDLSFREYGEYSCETDYECMCILV